MILSAGAFHSPQLLQCSGIGAVDTLKNRGITPIHELKGVGENLQDHLFYPISGEANAQEGINHYLPPLQQLKAAWNYFIHRKGCVLQWPARSDGLFRY